MPTCFATRSPSSVNTWRSSVCTVRGNSTSSVSARSSGARSMRMASTSRMRSGSSPAPSNVASSAAEHAIRDAVLRILLRARAHRAGDAVEVHADALHVARIAIELDELRQRLVVRRCAVEREVQGALGALHVAEALLEDPRAAVQVLRTLVGILLALDEAFTRAARELPLLRLRREVGEANERVLVDEHVGERALERLERERHVDEPIGVDQTEPVAQRLEDLRIALELRARHQRIRCLLPRALLPRDVGDRRVRAQVVRIGGEDLAVVQLRAVAIAEEVAVELGERAMDRDLRAAVGLVLEAVREQRGELVVVAVFFEQDAQPQECVLVSRISLERLLERGHRLLADERLVYQHDAGEVIQARLRVGILGDRGLAVGGLGDVAPQLALERGVAPAFARGDVAGQHFARLAELLDGLVDDANLGQRLAGARVERGLRARLAFEVRSDLLLEARV